MKLLTKELTIGEVLEIGDTAEKIFYEAIVDQGRFLAEENGLSPDDISTVSYKLVVEVEIKDSVISEEKSE